MATADGAQLSERDGNIHALTRRVLAPDTPRAARRGGGGGGEGDEGPTSPALARRATSRLRGPADGDALSIPLARGPARGPVAASVVRRILHTSRPHKAGRWELGAHSTRGCRVTSPRRAFTAPSSPGASAAGRWNVREGT